MSKILYPILNLPNEHDEENEAVPTWIKWWLINNYKKRSWVLSEIITGNPLTLNDSVQAKFPMPPLPRGNSKQDGKPSPTNEVPITNVTGDVEVLVQNKNLFDKDTMVIEGYINSQYNYLVNALTKSIIVPCKPNTTYTISKMVTDRLRVAYISTELEIGMKVQGALTNHTGSSITITTGDNAMYLLGYIWEQGSYNLQDVLDSIQVEQNTTATTYTPHQEQTYTFPLGTQRMFLGDYLADDGIHHPIRGQITLDGTENFENWTSGTNTIGFRLTNVNNLKNISSSTTQFILLSNCFVASTSQNALANNDLEGIATINGNLYFRIKKTTASDLAGFKTWLSTHNVTIEYELATEEITPYTTEQQQAYDEIKQAISYEEQTNISGSSSEAEPIFKVQYYMINESEGE